VINPLVASFTPSQQKGKIRMKNRTLSNKGFTLVEIMIVVAIIGLLAAIAIPNFVRARTTSQTNACINNLRQIDGASQQWALETKQSGDATVTFANIQPYLKNAVTCPAGGAASTFGTSYTLTTVSNKPTCQIVPATHVLPLDTSN
jgi:prepilin-type N-terminal cleavage/methylation domain-containing protein